MATNVYCKCLALLGQHTKTQNLWPLLYFSPLWVKQDDKQLNYLRPWLEAFLRLTNYSYLEPSFKAIYFLHAKCLKSHHVREVISWQPQFVSERSRRGGTSQWDIRWPVIILPPPLPFSSSLPYSPPFCFCKWTKVRGFSPITFADYFWNQLSPKWKDILI